MAYQDTTKGKVMLFVEEHGIVTAQQVADADISLVYNKGFASSMLSNLVEDGRLETIPGTRPRQYKFVSHTITKKRDRKR